MSEIINIDQSIVVKKIDKKTTNIQIFNNDLLQSIVGEFNGNLKKLENLSNTKIFFRGNSITIKGDNLEVKKVSDAIKFLANKFIKTQSIEENDINLSLETSKNTNSQNNVHTLSELIKTPRKSVIARSEKQSEYIKALRENNIVIALGPAGTGKSYLAVSVGITLLMEKKVEKVILSRPAVEAGERLGFLPGDMKEKVDPYLRPLYDALYDLFGYEKIQKKIDSGEIEIAPLAFMRGRTLKNSFAILDGSKCYYHSNKNVLTRIGENLKLLLMETHLKLI